MSTLNQGASYFKDIAKGVLIGAGILALIIAGLSFGGFGGGNKSTSSSEPTVSTSDSASPSPIANSNRTCSVAELATDPRLANFSGVVLDSATDEVLFDRNANTPAATASVMKIFTAAAAVLTLGPNYRVQTRVYQDATDPGTIILVGAGDPTLSRTAAGKKSVYADAPKLSTLALNVNKRLAATPITKIIVDATLFTGPNWEPSWEKSEMTEGYMSEVTALQVDGDRATPSAETSKRSSNSVMNAGYYFKKALGENAAGASVVAATMPASATEIASVSSQPISNWIAHMLQVSDNTQAEVLARLVAIDQGLSGSFASIDAAIKKALTPLGLNLSGMLIRDGSGLSDYNAVSPMAVAKLLQIINKPGSGLDLVRQSLPVSGEVGSLAKRFKGDNLDATGRIFAKTGWIKKGYTLAGLINAKDSTQLTFVVYALGNVKASAKTAIDNLVTGFYRCGGQLSNQ